MAGAMLARLLLAAVLACAACAAGAQQLYRWTDENGRTHMTDTPPPPGAKNVRRINAGAGGAAQKPAPVGLERPMKDFPVTLYSSINCADPCASARELLNKRGVPFTEVQVNDEERLADLKKLSPAGEVPLLKVGTSVSVGFQRSAYDALLDSAGYPREGVLPARAQAAPPPPEGFEPSTPPKAEPAKPEAAPPAGPYSPGSTPPRRVPK
jgi:glutaredoxin